MQAEEREYASFIETIVLEQVVYAEGTEVTQEDLETIETHSLVPDHCPACFDRRYEVKGYIGSAERNYLTDQWVVASANALGWTRHQLAEWATSSLGRHTIETQPPTQTALQATMQDSLTW